jgi:uncharacterized membrane protein YgcG
MSHHNHVPLAAIVLVVIAAGLFLAVLASRSSGSRRAARQGFIRNYEFPRVLRERLSRLHPEWTITDIDRAFEGLREFFLACLATPGMTVRMTSKPADDAWHEFIVCTHDYQRFCRGAYGRYLHHRPDEAKQHGEAWPSSCAAYVAAIGSGSGHGHGHGHSGCAGGHGHGCSSGGCSSGGGGGGCSSH